MKDYEYELDKSTGELVKKYVDVINNDGFKKVKNMWNYRIMKKRDPAMDEDFYFLSEVFYEKDGSPMAYTDNEFICGSTKEEIVSVLEMMLADAKKRQPALTEKDFKV